VAVAHRARSHCRFAPPVIHSILDSLTFSVPLFLKRRCGRTLGVAQARRRVAGPAAANGGAQHVHLSRLRQRPVGGWRGRRAQCSLLRSWCLVRAVTMIRRRTHGPAPTRRLGQTRDLKMTLHVVRNLNVITQLVNLERILEVASSRSTHHHAAALCLNAPPSVLPAARRLVRTHRVDGAGAPRQSGRRCDGSVAA
jgi:hypothetical protein